MSKYKWSVCNDQDKTDWYATLLNPCGFGHLDVIIFTVPKSHHVKEIKTVSISALSTTSLTKVCSISLCCGTEFHYIS